MWKKIRVGDPIVFVVNKNTPHPGPRAKQVIPARAGETYSYQVEKFWTVAEVRPDGHLLLITRRGKQHVVKRNDVRLRPARWWEKLLYQRRFPVLNTTVQELLKGMSNPTEGSTNPSLPLRTF